MVRRQVAPLGGRMKPRLSLSQDAADCVSESSADWLAARRARTTSLRAIAESLADGLSESFAFARKMA